jgi:hypothetical protein
LLDTRLILAAASVLALAFTFNCSKDDTAETATTAATGGSTASSGGMGGAGGGGVGGGTGGTGGVPCELCTCLANDGAAIEMISLDQDAPAAVGGAIRDGWYELTKVTAYTGTGGPTGASGRTFKQSMYFFGPDVEMVVEDNFNTATPELLVSMGYQPGDNGLIDFTVICPTVDTPYIPYETYDFVDGDPAKLILYTSGNADVAFEFDLTKAAGADDGTAG